MPKTLKAAPHVTLERWRQRIKKASKGVEKIRLLVIQTAAGR